MVDPALPRVRLLLAVVHLRLDNLFEAQRELNAVRSEQMPESLKDEIDEYLSSWYNNVMERVTGWYKRWVNVVVFVIAFLLAAALNINSIVVADALWDDPLLRSGVEAAVAAQIADTQNREGSVDAEAIVAELEQLEELGFPVGWTTDADDPRLFGPWTILGWLITAAAATLGAPFWFDRLKKVANLRGSGTVPATTPTSSTTTAS